MKQTFTFLSLLLLLNVKLFAATDKYRLTWRDDPSTTMVIAWNQISGTSPMVHYGPTDQGTNWASYPNSKSPDKIISYKGMNNHFVRLTGLLPDKAYYFVIKDSEGTSIRMWFKTAPSDPNTRLSVIAGGDSRNNATPRRNANKLVAKLRPHIVMFGGDMTDTGTNAQWIEWFNDWQLTRSADSRMYPVIAARGNHESSNNDIIDLFDAPGTGVYYALNLGGNLVRAYTLNTETTISGNQTTWLQNDLAANTGVIWKVAQYHKPIRPHNSGKSEGTNQYTYWAPLFNQYKMNLVVECDAHTVKTTWPIRPFTGTGSVEGFIRDDANGTVYVGEGCWGAPLRSNDDTKTWTRNSGMFNQFNWIFIDKDKIETRKVNIDNADQVASLTDATIFTMPANINVWNPSNGSVVTINKPSSNIAPQVSITNPANGTHYSSPQNVTISATASDADGTVARVEFYVNNTLVSTDLTSPYSFTYNIPAQGTYELTAKAVDNLGASTVSSAINVTCGVVSQVVTRQIGNGMDDVEENANGTIYTNSSDIELVNDGTAGDQVIGLRFTGLNIPQGATITKAYLKFTTDEATTATCNLTIRGEATVNASAFTTSTNNVSSRTKTSASINWNPAAWSVVGESATAQTSPELKTIVQELVNLNGFSSSSAMVFIITGTGKRTAEAYEGSTSQAPLLHIEYTTGGGTPANIPPTVSLVSPANNTQYTTLQTITLQANANDIDGSISSVSFYVNNALIGTDNTAPYSINWTPAAYGNYTLRAMATDNQSATTNSTNITVNFAQQSSSVSTSSRVSAGANDAEEAESGTMYLTSSDLELVYDTHQSAGNQQTAMRFLNLNIPKNAVITNAYIQFTCDETSSGATSLNVYGENTDNSSVFTTTAYNISSRLKTSAFVSWTPAAWNTVGEAGTNQRTPDLSSVLQQIVNRSGYTATSAISIIITGTGARIAEAYEGSAAQAPILYVTYSTATRVANDLSEYSNSFETKQLLVYPNPFNDYIDLTLDVNGKVAIDLFNEVGDLVWSVPKNNWNHKQVMHIPQTVKSGIYILKVYTEEGVYVKKMVKK